MLASSRFIPVLVQASRRPLDPPYPSLPQIDGKSRSSSWVSRVALFVFLMGAFPDSLEQSTLWLFNIAMENGHLWMVYLLKMVIFHGELLNSQMVHSSNRWHMARTPIAHWSWNCRRVLPRKIQGVSCWNPRWHGACNIEDMGQTNVAMEMITSGNKSSIFT